MTTTYSLVAADFFGNDKVVVFWVFRHIVTIDGRVTFVEDVLHNLQTPWSK
jgi:hypothetical protein